VIALFLAWACGGKTCGSEGCPLGTSCEDGECVSRSCATSTQCPLGYHCGGDGTCVAGCQQADDCALGSRCVASECREAECEVTALDCRWREWCEGGTCRDAGAPFCEPCTADAQCGEGNVCWAGEWCGIDCEATGSCPAGFACTELTHTDEQVHHVCLAACWLSQ
jgi:hypothetical protein